MNGILLYFPIVYWSAVYVGAQCPRRCRCINGEFVPEMGDMNMLTVSCLGDLREMPDLTVLSWANLPIYLDLSDNRIRVVTKDDIPPGLQIVVFILSSNDWVKIEHGAFENIAESLQLLKLEFLSLQFTHPFTFLRGLSKLTKLIMSFNYQVENTLARGLFYYQELTSLRELQLTSCDLTEIKDGAFRGLESLEILDLAENDLREVSKGIIRLPNLKTLKLNSNQFYVFPEATFMSSRFKLDYLAIDNHHCLVIHDDAFKGLEESVTELSLEGCQLLDIPINAIRKFRYLDNLNLRENPLTSLGRNSFKGSFCIGNIDLSGTFFPPAFMLFYFQRDCLHTINLNYRKLTSVPTEILLGMRSISEVNLKDNEIKTLRPNAFGEIPASTLMLSNNPLVEIQEGAFSDLPSSLLIGLENTHLPNLDFILDYGKDKFRQILFDGVKIPCTCTMLDIFKLIHPSFLEGNCWLRGKKYFMYNPKTKKDIEDYCRSSTVVPPLTGPSKLVPTPE